MKEKPKRLAPTSETLRELFLKSGNLCAFPNCTRLMMNEKGDFIGQVCHIEAALEGGERFNPKMTNEERRSAPNLLLMCYDHHKETDDVDEYPIKRMKKIKHVHEQRFSAPDLAILDQLKDWTTINPPKTVKNLKRINETLDWNNTDEELKDCVSELNEYIELLQTIPVEMRQFIGKIAQRMKRMSNTSAVNFEMFGTSILISDIKDAFRIGDSTILKKLVQLESYGVGCLDEINTDLGNQPMIRIDNLESGWPIWLDIIEFCNLTNIPLETFTNDLDFSHFDK